MSFFTGYLAQGTGGANGFVENTASGYARQAVTLNPLGNANTSLLGIIYFPASTTTVVTQRALYDASTNGNLIMWWNLMNQATIAAGAFDTLKPGALNHTFPKLYTGIGMGSAEVDFLNGERIGTTDTGLPIFAGHYLSVVNGTIAAKSSV